ncbi:MAG: zf-TFIIB domain-containing protein [Candidatus Altiarchaeota archaeon]
MDCPKDGSIMVEKHVGKTRLDFCSGCNGIWMDWGELGKISGNTVTEHELKYRGKSGRRCPKCGRQMNKADIHSVIVEECRCGLFFDAGEAEDVIGRKLTLTREMRLKRSQVDELMEKGSILVGDTELFIEE